MPKSIKACEFTHVGVFYANATRGFTPRRVSCCAHMLTGNAGAYDLVCMPAMRDLGSLQRRLIQEETRIKERNGDDRSKEEKAFFGIVDDPPILGVIILATDFHHTLEDEVMSIVVIDVLEIEFFKKIGEDRTIKLDKFKTTNLQLIKNMPLI